MKKILAMALAIFLLLSLAACDDNGGTHNKEKTITFNEMTQAFKDTGYEVKVYKNVDDPEIPMGKATSCSLLSFVKIDDEQGKEYGGSAYFYEFANVYDASAAMGNGTPDSKFTNESYGKKDVLTEGHSKFGTKWITIQVGKVMIIMCESYDIDGSGTYNDGIEKVVDKLGL